MPDHTLYSVRYIHKVSQRCKCGHGQYSHHDLQKVHGSEWGHGPCTGNGCECMDYEHGDIEQAQLPSDVYDDGAVKAIERMLHDAKLLCKADRLASVRRERIAGTDHHRLVCFPQGGTWHSVILEPWQERPSESGSDVVRTAHHGIYRIRWTRDARCYVNSLVNGGLIGAHVQGRWDDQGRLPDSVRAYADSVRPVPDSPGGVQ